MDSALLVGGMLAAGLVIFLIGAGGWRMDYERPLPESLAAIASDRRRWVWIHTWMIAAMFVTPAGLAGLVVVVEDPTAVVLTVMAAVVYLVGSACWIASLTFRLGVAPWAATRTVAEGQVPDGYAALNHWSGLLYVVHMLSAYLASALLGVAMVVAATVPVWLGWVGLGWGLAFALGFTLTRFAGWFNPPFWAHLYTGAVGVALLLG